MIYSLFKINFSEYKIFKFYFIKINYIYYKINIYININIKNKEFNILNLKYIFNV